MRPGSSSPSIFALHDEHERGSVCTFRGQRVLSFFYNTGVMNLAPASAVVIISNNPKISMHMKKLLSKMGLSSPN